MDEIKKQFEYALNAIYYCILLRFRKFYYVDVDNHFLMKYVFCHFPESIYNKVSDNIKNSHGFLMDMANGWAKFWFGFLYSSFPWILTCIIAGLIIKSESGIEPTVALIPICIAFIPAYKAVFSNDRYKQYHRQFKKGDEAWHKKWKRRTIAFCIVAALSDIIIGPALAWTVLLW